MAAPVNDLDALFDETVGVQNGGVPQQGGQPDLDALFDETVSNPIGGPGLRVDLPGMEPRQSEAIAQFARENAEIAEMTDLEFMLSPSVAGAMLKNTPGSAYRNFKDMLAIFSPAAREVQSPFPGEGGQRPSRKVPFANFAEMAGLVTELQILAAGKALGAVPEFAKTDFDRRASEIESSDLPRVNAVLDFYRENYGIGPENVGGFRRFVVEDPVGFMSDAMTILSLGSGTVAKGARAAAILPKLNAGKYLIPVEKAALAAQTAFDFADPAVMSTKALGFGVEKVAKGPVTRALAPFAEDVNPRMVALAEKHDLDLPASSLSDSKTVPIIEGGAVKMGDRNLRMKVEKADADLRGIADKLVDDIGTDPDLMLAGQKIVEGFEAFEAAADARIKVLFGAIGDTSKVGGKYDKTLAVLDDIRKQTGDADIPDADFAALENLLQPIIDANDAGKVTLASIDQTRTVFRRQKNAHQRRDPKAVGNEAHVKQIYGALTEDMFAAAEKFDPALAEQIRVAKLTYAENLEKINGEIGKKIYRLRHQPDRIVPLLFKPNMSQADIGRIFEMVGPEAQKGIQAAFMSEMFKKSQSRQRNWKPTGLRAQLDAYGRKKVEAIVGKDGADALDEIAEISMSFGNLRQITEGSQTGFINRILTSGDVAGVSIGIVSQFYGGGLPGILAGLSAIVGPRIFNGWIVSADGQRYLLQGTPLGGDTGRAIQNLPTTVPRSFFQAGRALPKEEEQ